MNYGDEVKLHFISFNTPDKLQLPGLLFEPQKTTKKAAVWLHGMGDNGVFYNPESVNALAEALTVKGISLLAFNNRGAHNSKTIRYSDAVLAEEGRFQGGTHYEKIADCIHDIDGAADFLKQAGYDELYLMGHSTGANKICNYDYQKKTSPFAKYVLSGPGDDTGLFFCELGEKRFYQALKYAQKAMEEGKPLTILPAYTGMNPFSAQAAVDILDPDGDYNTFPFFEVTTKRLGIKPLFKEYSGITVPLMVIIGQHDEFAYTAGGADKALDIFLGVTSNQALKKSSFTLIDGADHSFRDHNKEYAHAIARWLSEER